ncbi:hypothetical protein R1flu_027304 [Riccia fluitans]|uniref:Oleosin n=1 Tax=Riccia fluitans TaxID=41844 RepID=A0ABD1XLC7_9MARC
MPKTDEQLTKTVPENAPNRRQLIATGSIAVLSAAVAFITMTTVGGLVIALMTILTLVFIVFSPVLVPIGTLLLLGAAAIVTPTSVTVAVVTSLRWLYKYFKGQKPVGSGFVDATNRFLLDTACRLLEYGGIWVGRPGR